MDWFESYVDQSVTFPSWRKIEAKLCQQLKKKLEKKMVDPVNHQLLFQIMGDEFVNKHFSSYTSSPAVLDNIRPEEKEKKMSEMKSLITSIIDNAVQKKGSKSDSKVQSELSAFTSDMKKMIHADMEAKSYGGSKSKKKATDNLSEKYLRDLLSYDPSTIHYILPSLQHQVIVLTDVLRLKFWFACILTKEKSKNLKNSEKIKEKFVEIYNQQRNDKDDVINSAVYKFYKETFCFKNADSDNQKLTALILNICDTYGRKFADENVPYAVAIQNIFLNSNNYPSGDDIAVASIMTEKVLRLGVLSNENSVKIADKIVEDLKEVDQELLNHISSSLLKNQDAKPDASNIYSQKKIASFINKWLINGFVTHLNSKCLFFVWDQLFFHKWESKMFHTICMALLGLLKPWFLYAMDEDKVSEVFNKEPGFLYLLDLRNAIMHLQRKGNFSDVPVMNRNIKFAEREHTPTPPPKVPTPQPKAFVPWVPYNKPNSKEAFITKSKLDFPFDLYIDAVRFVPDNATFIKVSGKILNMYIGQKNKSIKFQAYPMLESFWRYPDFKLKQTVNLECNPMNPDVVIMMRVYTVEKHSQKNCVLGSCLFGPFSNKHGKQPTLRTGGHQIRVRHGIPDPDFTIEHMLASHMDNNPFIPGLTILLRVLPHSKDFVSGPEYETNMYRSDFAKPNESEIKLYKHYQESDNFSKTVRDITLLQIGQTTSNDASLNEHIQLRLQKEGSDVEDFPYQRYVNYNKEHGIMVLADKASGLPLFLEGRYLQCLIQIFPGEDSKIGNGKSQVVSFATEELELSSPQRAPDWSDEPKRVQAEYDDRAFILVSLYGLRPRYDSSKEKVTDKEGREPRFNLQHAIAWSALTCFDKGAVLAGIHHIPLLKGRPPEELMEKLSYLPLDYVCKKFKSLVKVFEAASIELSVWDGHFIDSECPPLPVHTNLLNISPNPSKYLKAAERTTGATAADLLRQGLNNPSDFSYSKKKFIELLHEIFKKNFDEALLKAGFAATI